MKKSTVVLVAITISVLEFFLFLYLHLTSQFENEMIPIIVMGCAYLIPVILCLAIIFMNREFDNQTKWKWSLYILLTYFIGCFHFYTKFGKDFDRMISE